MLKESLLRMNGLKDEMLIEDVEAYLYVYCVRVLDGLIPWLT